jgi:hypothetical protein
MRELAFFQENTKSFHKKKKKKKTIETFRREKPNGSILNCKREHFMRGLPLLKNHKKISHEKTKTFPSLPSLSLSLSLYLCLCVSVTLSHTHKLQNCQTSNGIREWKLLSPRKKEEKSIPFLSVMH